MSKNVARPRAVIAYVMEHVLLTSFGGAGIHVAYLSECNTQSQMHELSVSRSGMSLVCWLFVILLIRKHVYKIK